MQVPAARVSWFLSEIATGRSMVPREDSHFLPPHFTW